MKIYTCNIIFFVLFCLVIGNTKLNGQTNKKIQIKAGVGIDWINLDTPIKKGQLKKYGKFNVKRVIIPIKPKIRSLRRKIYYFENGLTITIDKRHLFHKYRIKAIEITLPLLAVDKMGVELGKSDGDDVIQKYGSPEGEYDQTHELDYPGKKGKLVQYYVYNTKGIRFYIDSSVYKIVVYKPQPMASIE